ncbi:hypothetical protein LPB41_19360 [Thalassospira sp. MA62]|nr:hypothetical protein [Thalassospira sp. MA62]
MGLYDSLMSVTNTAQTSSKMAEQARTTIASNSQPLPQKNKEENAELAYIRENGFTTYVKEIEERKVEQMRHDMLQNMGLSEEDLAEMETANRQAIEKSISNAIERKLNGNTLAEIEMGQTDSSSETADERRDRMQAQLAFDPHMFAVFTELQSKLPGGANQSILGPEDKDDANASPQKRDDPFAV